MVSGNILVVDDDFGTREIIRHNVVEQGFQASAVASGELALEALKSGQFDLVLLDVLMPGLDGHEVLNRLKSDPDLQHIPVVMISGLDDIKIVVRCIEDGAEDFLTKPFDPTLLRARVRSCLEKKNLRDKEQDHLAAIEKVKLRLEQELNEASNYVKSILPKPFEQDGLSIDWRYTPSTELGGDIFGYAWIDSDSFAIYLLDVCGHGVGASLLSVSVLNTIASGEVSNIDFKNPSQVLAKLNSSFPMEKQNNMFFSMWYAVLDVPSGKLKYAGGGHPPALLIDHENQLIQLESQGPIIGIDEGVHFESQETTLKAGAQLYLYSDGVYEHIRDDGSTVDFDTFQDALLQSNLENYSLSSLENWARSIHSQPSFEDDFSIVKLSYKK